MRAPQGGPGRKQFFIEKLAFFGRNTLLLCERCARHVQGRQNRRGLGKTPSNLAEREAKLKHYLLEFLLVPPDF